MAKKTSDRHQCVRKPNSSVALCIWICFAVLQAWLQDSFTPTRPGGGERNDDLTLQKTHDSSSLLLNQVPKKESYIS